MRNFVRLFGVSFAAFILFLFYACSGGEVVLKTGQPAPSVSLEDLSGGTVGIPEDVKGRVAAIRFWSVSCRSCREEMPKMNEVYRKYRNRGLEIIAINVGDEKGAVEKFVQESGISYPVLLDPSKEVTKRYGVNGVPVTFILDRAGIIRQKILGESGVRSFEDNVLRRLAGGKPS